MANNTNIKLNNFFRLVKKEDRDDPKFQISTIIEKLILFENLTLESHRLSEIPVLINSIGYESTIALLDCGDFVIHSDRIVLGSWNKELLKLVERFKFRPMKFEAKKSFEKDISNLRGKCDLSLKEFKKLEEKLDSVVNYYSGDTLTEFHKSVIEDFKTSGNYLIEAIKIKIAERLNVNIPNEEIQAKIHYLDKELFKIESNLKNLLDIDRSTEYEIVTDACFGVGRVNEKILQMSTYNSTTGFQPDEVSIFQEKIKFLENQFDTTKNTEQLQRVINLAGFPSIEEKYATEGLNLEHLLEIRKEDEVVNFRNWLYSTEYISDEKLEDMLNNLKVKLSKVLDTGWGKSLKFIFSTGLGAMPGVGQVVGAGYSLIDTFVLESLLSQPGAITFISRQYPTIFED